MLNRTVFMALCALTTFATVPTSAAETSDWHLNFAAAAGGRYDTNVGIADIDTSAGEADSVMEYAAGATLVYAPDESPFSARVGYDFAGSSYNRFSLFDLDLHHVTGSVEYHNAQFDSAITFDQYKGLLDGEDYVSITQVSPSISRLFGSRVYVRAAFISMTRDYDNLSERNARNAAPRLDTYLLLDGLDRYIAVGAQFNNETAASSEFEYKGNALSLSYVESLQLSRMPLKLTGSLRYEKRNYTSESPSIEQLRRDRRWRMGIEAEVPFSEQLSMHATLERTDNISNLESANLEKTVAGLEFRLAF